MKAGFLFFLILRCFVGFELGLSLFSFSYAFEQESHPGLGKEVLFTQAVIDFNKKKFNEALSSLQEILKTSPTDLQSLELMALTFKGASKDKESLEVYQRLLSISPPEKKGAYQFEIAMIYYKQRKFIKSQPYFEKAISSHFNEVTSRLYLGLIYFNLEKYADAKKKFSWLIKKAPDEYKLISHYYLGLIYFKNSDGPEGVSEILQTRKIAQVQIKENPSAVQLLKASNKILAPFDHGQFFGFIGISGEYDSNFASIASSLASSASKTATSKLNLTGGVGRMSPSTNTVQFVGNYHFNLNKNFNSEARGYEYFNQSPSLYMNFKPLNPLTGGVKLEGGFLFQNLLNQPSDPSSGYTFSRYLLSLEGGGFTKYKIKDDFQLELEMSCKKTIYYTQDSQSGHVWAGKAKFQNTAIYNFLDPYSISFLYSKNLANDKSYDSITYGSLLTNQVKISSKNSLVFSYDLEWTKYTESLPVRSDQSQTVILTWIYNIKPKVDLTSDLIYSLNKSSIPESYSYKRNQFTFGINYSF